MTVFVCVFWSLWHAEQLLFSCLCSKVAYVKCKMSRTQKEVTPHRELIPPITAFLEEDLKLVHTGGNLTPGDGVGSRRSFRTPTQKLTVVKPRCYQVTRLTSRISPNKTPEKSYFNIFVSRWQAFQTLRHPPSCLLQTFVIITTAQQLVRNIFIGWLYFYQPMRIMLVEPLSTKHKMVMADSLNWFAPRLEILELWSTGAFFG